MHTSAANLPYFYGKTHLRPFSGNFSNLYGKNKMEPPAKRKSARFLSSWTLPPGITASSKGPSFAYCKLYCTYDTSICPCPDFCLPCVFVSYAYEMYRNFIPCTCNLCIHPCFVGFGEVIFYDYLHKKNFFLGKKSSTQVWSKIL